MGKRDYDIHTSAKDSWFMALFTFGEGYHNYHHKFEWDYRNGIKWYNFDPSKWIIRFLSFFNITYSLKKASDYNIFKAKIDTIVEKIHLLSDKNLDKDYLSKASIIIESAFRNLSVLKKLESKYRDINEGGFSKKEYKKQIKSCKHKIQKSLVSLMTILVNIKSVI